MTFQFPAFYHSHHLRNPEDLSFWMEIAQNFGDPILELGCGTGRVLVPLAEAGYRTFGLDIHPGMLFYLQTNLPQVLEHPPQVFVGDMSAFGLAMRFPLILMPCNTYSTLSPGTRKKTLENVTLHLARGGRFSFSIPNPKQLLRMPEHGDSEVEDIFLHPEDGEPVQVSSVWERTSDNFILRWHYDHLFPDGRIDRHTVVVSHWILPPETYIQEIDAAGMQVNAIYGDFDSSTFTHQSPNFILTASLP